MAAEEWVWLRNPATDGVQHVPPSAVQTWMDLGWEETEAPPEPNPALAEYQPLHRPVEPARPKRASKRTADDTETAEISDEKEMNTDG